ncbi:hypothetical protein WN943_003425 [Citrus x changshan-huyou]
MAIGSKTFRTLRIAPRHESTVIKIDYNTELATRGKFARIAVEVSLGSPLISQFLQDGRIQRIEYEALPIICFGCGKYGHTSPPCLDNLILEARGEKTNDMAPGETTNANSEVLPAVVTPDNPRFCPWMIVARRGNCRGNKGRTDTKEPNQNSFGKQSVGSRFSVLRQESELDNDAGVISNAATTMDNHKKTAPLSIPPKPNPNEEPPDIGDRDMENVEEDSSDRAASPSFGRTFKMFAQNYKPKLVALCEPRISGIKADDFLRCSGYDHSHRVEAASFSAIYESPAPSLRNFLWRDLNYLAESIQGPWMLAGSHQTSFVPGRHITENIIIAQEIIHSMRRKMGKRGFMVFKVDLEKAYDRLSWDFIKETLAFVEASSEQTKVVIKALNNFCNMFGEKVSTEKTRLYFSKNVEPALSKKISELSGFSTSKNLGKYLGMPLLHGRVTNKTYQEILDRVDKQLSGWNVKHLSFVGRLTFTQAVIQALPIYSMQTTVIPRGTQAKINHISHRFIWSGNSERSNMSMASWDRICQPKMVGGLGLKNFHHINEALLMKIVWNIIVSPTSLWSKVLCSKYGVENDNLSTEPPTKYGSCVWRAVGTVWQKVLQGIRWQVGDRSKVRFWKDCWVMQNVMLKDYIVMPVPSNMLEKSIMDYVDDNGQWNWFAFSNYLPHSLALAIVAIMPPCVEGGMDRIF